VSKDVQPAVLKAGADDRPLEYIGFGCIGTSGRSGDRCEVGPVTGFTLDWVATLP
jgi:hypothetical protein